MSLSTLSWRPRSLSWRGGLLLAVTAAAVIGLALHGPIPQDSAYHQFADQRTLLGIPNLWNVASNGPFLLVGLYGLFLLRRGHCGSDLAHLRPAYNIFFLALCLVAVGSAYYHLTPTDATLVWDRAPMTLAFMAFFSAFLREHMLCDLMNHTLAPLLIVGLCSIGLWLLTGDLRAYALIQFLPILLMPFIFFLYPSNLPGNHFVWAVLVAYAGAKVFEHFDAAIYSATGFSGHALKHIAAAIAVFFVALLIKARPVHQQ